MTLMFLKGQTQKKHLALKKKFVGRELDLLTSLCAHYDHDLNTIETLFAIPTVISHKLSTRDVEYFHYALLKRIGESTATKVLVMGPVALQVLLNVKYQDVYKVRGKSWIQTVSGREVYFVVSIDPEEVTEDPTLFTDLVNCAHKFFMQDAPYPAPKLTQWLVESPAELAEALDSIRSSAEIVCDTETTGLDPLTDRLITLGLCVKNIDGESYTSIIVPKEIVYNDTVIQTLYDFMCRENRTLVFHNAKFDLKWLQVYFRHSFYDADTPIEDTMLMSYVLDERTTHRSGGIHGLKTLARIKFDAEEYATDFDAFFKIPVEKRDYPALYRYLSKDLVYTHMLYEHFKDTLSYQGYLEEDGFYYGILIPATLALAEIELHGVKVDIPYLRTLGKTYAAEIERIKAEIQEYLFTQVEDKPHLYSIVDHFNPGSPPQILKVMGTIFGLDKVVEDTSRETLQTVVSSFEGHPAAHFCNLILDYREYTKIQNTYVKKLIDSADANGRVHGNFNLNGTSTGRLSSDNPNLQNIPRGLGAAIRKSFIVPDGFTFVNADYSQLEIRVAATLSGDRDLTAAYQDGRDIHRETASRVFKVPYENVTGEQRTITKRLVFGILYGISAYGMVHTLAEEGITVTEKEAAEYINNFLGAFPGYTEWRSKTEAEFRLDQELQTLFGRKRRWPYLNTINQNSAVREAVNFPIQSTASDLCLISIAALHGKIKALGGYIVFTVHDSIAFEVPTDKLEDAKAVIKAVMEDVPITTPVPFRVDVESGERWGK